MISRDQLKERFRKIAVWRNGDQRAPHKPLLILYALSRLDSAASGKIAYKDVDEALRPLLAQFGPSRKSYYPELPFWHLQTDGIWELNIDPATIPHRKGSKNPTKGQLLSQDVRGGFSSEIYTALKEDPFLVSEVVSEILESHFPSSMHDEILASVGLELQRATVIKQPRDAAFRETVLRAYEYRCAVCDFDIRIGNQTLGIEAAHVKWHQAGGPSTADNGVALCILHHKMFDYGAFTMSQNTHKVIVSEKAHGTSGFHDLLMQYHGKPLRQPINPLYLVNDVYVQWHENEVFKKPARHLEL